MKNKITDKQLEIIYEELKANTKTYSQIAKEIGCHVSSITGMNAGRIRRMDQLHDDAYPVRISNKVRNERAIELFSRTKDFAKVEEKYRIGESHFSKVLYEAGWKKVLGQWVDAIELEELEKLLNREG